MALANQLNANLTFDATLSDAFSANVTGGANHTLADFYIERLVNLMNIFYTPFLVTSGLIGNILSVIVFLTSKLRMQSTSQYLSALAVSDSMFLLQLLPPWLNAVQVTEVFHRHGFCQTFVYTSYVTSGTSAWLVVAFTVERFVAVLYPLRRNVVCTVARARYVIGIIIGAALLINAPVLKYAVSNANGCNIDYEYLEHAERFNIVDTAASFTIPLAVIIFLNTWIMVAVWRLEKARRQLVREQRPRRGLAAARERPPRLQGYQRAQQRITRMLLFVSTVFVVLNMPAYTMRILAYAYNMGENEYVGKWAAMQQISYMFFNTNFGINFLLYCLSGQNFRRTLLLSMPWVRNRARDVMMLRPFPPFRPARAASLTTFMSCTEASVYPPCTRFPSGRIAQATGAPSTSGPSTRDQGTSAPSTRDQGTSAPDTSSASTSGPSISPPSTLALELQSPAPVLRRSGRRASFIQRWKFDNTRQRRPAPGTPHVQRTFNVEATGVKEFSA